MWLRCKPKEMGHNRRSEDPANKWCRFDVNIVRENKSGKFCICQRSCKQYQ